MRTILASVLFLAASACADAPERPGRETGGRPEPVPAVNVEPDQVPDGPVSPALVAPAPAPGYVDCTASLAAGDGIRPLCLRDPSRQVQLRAVHLPDEVGSPYDVLLKHAKAYHTRITPHLPFPTVEQSADKLLATESVRVGSDDGELGIASAYRKLPDLPGIVAVSVLAIAPEKLSDLRFAELEREAHAVAIAIKVEMRRAPAAP